MRGGERRGGEAEAAEELPARDGILEFRFLISIGLRADMRGSPLSATTFSYANGYPEDGDVTGDLQFSVGFEEYWVPMEYVYLKIKTSRGVQQVQFVKDRLTFGRHRDNSVPLADQLASRFHCAIERQGDTYTLHDLQSRNGTLLNGARVMTAKLSPNDVVTVGETQITLMVRKGDGKAAPEPAAEDLKLGERGLLKRPAPAKGAPPKQEEVLDELEEVPEGIEVLDDLEVIEDEGPIDLVGGDDEESPVDKLRKLADSMPQKDFDIDAIELINTRGKPLLGAGGAVATERESATLFRLVLLICFRSHASDIHLEPRADEFLMRLRVDGNLIDLAHLTRELGTKISALAKVLCDLDTTQRSIVQEGHFAARAPLVRPGEGLVEGRMRRVDYRVSFVPTLYGQKLVIRTFDSASAPLMVDDLQLPAAMAGEINKQLNLATGIILVCGPTGSGKTTTLYSLLRSCGVAYRNILTIEDPVEVQIEGTTQLPVNEEEGKSFATLLRSALRQDPDVIMVGEVRDSETAKIALQAAITGHMVFSTIHTRDTVGTIFRLLDLGVEPYMIAQGVHIVLAQRLVRKLCVTCRRAFAPTPEDRARLGPSGEKVKTLYAPKGCPACLGSGFAGRRAVFEMLAMSDALRERITRSPNQADIQALLATTGFVSLQRAGYELVAAGVTSFDEVERAVGAG
jgi:type II secretory ATPase GspE/PulE/Tfp pilus assembly ATPase PilB-like protein